MAKMINEIGDTERGQYAIGRVARRAYHRGQRTSGADKKKYNNTLYDAYIASTRGGKQDPKLMSAFTKGEYDETSKYLKDNTNENMMVYRMTESELRGMIRESITSILNDEENPVDVKKTTQIFIDNNGFNLYNAPVTWINEYMFKDKLGKAGFVFKSEDDAKKFLFSQQNFDNAVNSVSSTRQELGDKKFTNFLRAAGIERKDVNRIMATNDIKLAVQEIIKNVGPEFFLSTYTTNAHKMPNGYILYF